jgi:hypothetical protein
MYNPWRIWVLLSSDRAIRPLSAWQVPAIITVGTGRLDFPECTRGEINAF